MDNAGGKGKGKGNGIGFWEELLLIRHHNSFNSILFGNKQQENEEEEEEEKQQSSSSSSSPSSTSPSKYSCIISSLSPLANSVIARCSKILGVPTQVLLHRFEETKFNQQTLNSTNLLVLVLEFFSYQALHVLTHPSHSYNYLTDKDFRRLTYDMMLAWEQHSTINSNNANSIHPHPQDKSQESTFPNNNHNQGVEEEDHDNNNDDQEGWSLFYTNSITMAVQVDDEKTVGPEAFARIAPACPAIADIITVHNLFDVLTSSSDGQLHFLIYDKYLASLDKVIKTAKCATVPPLCSNLKLAEGEIILNVDGTVPTQPVLQHIGISAWPGRLTLTNYAIYFEAGVGLYDKPVRYDLTMESKQVVKPELTGPLGARLFDDAVMYKSTSVDEPVYLEFPEFKGHSRRDYWLENILEVLHAHTFIKKYNFKELQRMEVLSKTILGIFRLRAVREAFHIFPSHYKTLLGFNLAEKLPRGDMILETLSNRIQLLSWNSEHDAVGISPAVEKQLPSLSPVSLVTLTKLGFVLARGTDADKETEILVGDVCVGEINPLETAVKQSKCDTGRAETAQATVDQVKVEGIDTNIAVMKYWNLFSGFIFWLLGRTLSSRLCFWSLFAIQFIGIGSSMQFPAFWYFWWHSYSGASIATKGSHCERSESHLLLARMQ
ncbi:hypothetical protein AQUCO_09100093v1 [Aquilegia coerulea]|uniref:Uncharacterized protein n=1 Tax=Aquilegia coerulea TaxID=218851 RepID=A0A2G5C600_AQUCA|nr:hypothetical protein AQUCO_09100093v1 [Aquilegia coerulea]